MWAQAALLSECQSGPRETRENAGAVEETRDNGGLATDGVGRLQAPPSTRNPLPRKPSGTSKTAINDCIALLLGFPAIYIQQSPHRTGVKNAANSIVLKKSL